MAEKIAPGSIRVRELDQGPDENTPRYWFGNDVFVTHFFNALSSTFPEGERFFIRSVRRYADRIDNVMLAREVTAFVGQEGQHSKAHDVHVALLVDQGYGVLRTINGIQRVVMNWLNNRAPRLGEFLIQTATGNDSDTWAPTPLARLVLLSSGSMRDDA